MTGNKATLPREHIQRIREVMTNSLRLDNNPHLKSFGINVNREPIKLDAQMIHPAEVLFKNRAVCPMKSGSVQFAPLKNTQFWKPATIGMVAVVDFDNMQLDLTSFCKNLHEKCSINGLKMTTQPTSWRHFNLHSNDTENLKSEMSNLKKQNVTIIIGITKEKKPAVHDVLKYFEATLGLQTLQIHVNTATHFIKNTGTQTVENVIRKLNPKCGGVNFVVEPPQSVNRQPVCSNITDVKRRLFGKTQFIGFEMTHGSARTLFDQSQGTFDGEPTIVGCAYSLELATDLGGFNYLQEMNEYKLKNLEEKFGKCLKHYETAVGHLPETVVVFRTGAGEGDFKRVQDEIADMKKALEGRKIQLVVLVVQKTSHTRIFPENIEGTSALSQNVKSGTVVDGGITSFGRQEFILVSQTGQIGTVKPIKYTVAANDPGWTKNELCHLTYFLAFGHQVSYQPPAVPHILYAAENLAKRGRNNFLTHK
uniref:Piwi domain-containing protein n=1 Tax=Caenorhabditis tropicalis TaxID=1561998 RepID=A0A1I7UFP8_9PELO